MPHRGLILRPKEPEHWQLGSGKASARFGGTSLNPSGDWTPYKTADEPQSRPNFDTEGCAVFGTLKAWMMLARFLGFNFMTDASERYTGAWAGTGPNGTDPHVVAEDTRTFGMVPGVVMPWTDQTTFETYYDQAMARSLLPFGRELLDQYEFGHEWVFPCGSDHTPKEKQQLLQDALKRGPVCVSLDGDYRYVEGRLTKPKGGPDSHWAVLLKHDGKHGTIHDQYDPFEKELASNYDHMAAKVYFLKAKPPIQRNFWSGVWADFRTLWTRLSNA